MLQRIQAALLAVALLLLAPTPTRADTGTTTTTTTTTTSTISLRNVCFPGIVQSIAPNGTVVLDVNGTSVTIPPSVAQWELNNQAVAPSGLTVGQPAAVFYPNLTGTLSSSSNGFITLQTSSGSMLIPVMALDPRLLNDTGVYVQLHNGNIVQVPLSTAVNLQYLGGATILSTLPAGAIVMTMSHGQSGLGAVPPHDRHGPDLLQRPGHQHAPRHRDHPRHP